MALHSPAAAVPMQLPERDLPPLQPCRCSYLSEISHCLGEATMALAIALPCAFLLREGWGPRRPGDASALRSQLNTSSSGCLPQRQAVAHRYRIRCARWPDLL